MIPFKKMMQAYKYPSYILDGYCHIAIKDSGQINKVDALK